LTSTNRGPKREVEDEDDCSFEQEEEEEEEEDYSRWRMSRSQVMDSVWARSTVSGTVRWMASGTVSRVSYWMSTSGMGRALRVGRVLNIVEF
jgi:hypothetical protein